MVTIFQLLLVTDLESREDFQRMARGYGRLRALRPLTAVGLYRWSQH